MFRAVTVLDSVCPEANIPGLPYLTSWGFSQSVPWKLHGTSGLAALQM